MQSSNRSCEAENYSGLQRKRIRVSHIKTILICGGIAVLLSACAQAPLRIDGEDDPALSALSGSEAKPREAAPAPRVEPLPNVALSPRILYQMLLAEVAGHRGNLTLSVSAYLDLAKTTRDPRIARRAAEIANFARKNEAALEASQLWVEIDPQSSLARQMAIRQFAIAGRINEIEPHLAKLMDLEPERRGEALLRLSGLFTRFADKQAAFAMTERLTEPYLDLPEARFTRAQMAGAAGANDRGLEEIDAALEKRPDWEQAIMLKALLQQRDSSEAMLRTLREFLAKYPKSRDVRLQYARALASEKRPKEAREQFEKLVQEFPGNPDVVLAVGILAIQLNDYEGAEANFKSLLERGYHDSNRVRYYLGQIAETQKRYPEALEWYQAVTAGEQHLPAQLRYAQVLGLQGKLDDARSHLHKIPASNNQERIQVLLAEAQMLREAGRARDAFDLLDEKLQTQPNQPDLLYETALMAERIGRMDLLESSLRKLIQIKPDHAHAYNALGYSLADRGERLEEAHDLIAKALELAPDDAFIIDSMGWVLFRKGDLEAALGYLQRAYSLRPDPEIAAHLGEVLWAMGRRDDATKTWREAEKANPENEVLSKVIKRFAP